MYILFFYRTAYGQGGEHVSHISKVTVSAINMKEAYQIACAYEEQGYGQCTGIIELEVEK